MNLPSKFIHFIESLYNNSSLVAKWNIIDTEEIKVHKGLHQGCPLSPALFLLYINDVVNYYVNNEECQKMKIFEGNSQVSCNCSIVQEFLK